MKTVERILWSSAVAGAFLFGFAVQRALNPDQFTCPLGAKKSVAVVFCQAMVDPNTITAVKYRYDGERWAPEYRQEVEAGR